MSHRIHGAAIYVGNMDPIKIYPSHVSIYTENHGSYGCCFKQVAR